jgi:DNA topoisomerase-1
MNGRYGAYIVSGKDNYKIPKGHLPENLTYQDCLNIISTSSPTGKKGELQKQENN